MSEPKETPPAIGNIQLKEGKAQIMTVDGLIAFDLDYVVGLIKKALRNSRPGYYTEKIRGYAAILKAEGLDGIDIVTPRMKILCSGREVNKQFLNHISDLLGKLKMFRNINTAPKEEINDNVIEHSAV